MSVPAVPSWRPMQPSDLTDADALGSAFHVHHPERPDIAPERLRLAPDWCFVLDRDGGFAGYAVCHPWSGALPPALDRLIGRLPPGCDHIHIHDVVLLPALRGRGLAGGLVEHLAERAGAAGFSALTLIGVGGADRAWARQGFVAEADPAVRAFVRAAYGDGAVPMRRSLAVAAALG